MSKSIGARDENVIACKEAVIEIARELGRRLAREEFAQKDQEREEPSMGEVAERPETCQIAVRQG